MIDARDAEELLNKIRRAANEQAESTVPKTDKQVVKIDTKKYTLGSLQEELYNTAVRNGWFDTDTKDIQWVPTQLALIHCEASEALDVYRNMKDLADIDEVYDDEKGLKGFFVEIADVLMRTLVLCEHYNVDIERIILLKNTENKSRGYKHGGKLI